MRAATDLSGADVDLLPQNLLQRPSPGAGRCKRLCIAVCGALVLSTEFTGTALLLWVGRNRLIPINPNQSQSIPITPNHSQSLPINPNRIEDLSSWLAGGSDMTDIGLDGSDSGSQSVSDGSLGLVGMAAFMALWVVGMLCCLPSTPFWLLGGFVWARRSLLCAIVQSSRFGLDVPVASATLVNCSALLQRSIALLHSLQRSSIAKSLTLRWRGSLAIGLNAAGCWLGAAVCFAVARQLRRCGDRCKVCARCCGLGSAGSSRAGGKPSVLQALNKMVGENQYKATLVSRVAYAPMAVKNFGYQP
eukprot:SAG31_NODE_3453_length_4253_cov_2.708233_5_plen_304_part_00